MERKKKLSPIKNPKSVEVTYRKELLVLVRQLKHDTDLYIIPLLYDLEPEYVKDAFAKTLEEAFNRLRSMYTRVDVLARSLSDYFVKSGDRLNKKNFYSSVENAVGVNLQTIIQKENIEDILVATTRENVNLIKTIPEEYFKKIESVVFKGTLQSNSAKGMMEEIRQIGGVSEKRAKLIARDQTSKLNSALTKKRSEDLGIEEYVWRTSEDERVRDTHEKNNGKTFRFDTPPPVTGHPGNDIQCRCVAQPIIQF